jgi:hypothetical protein
MLGTGRPGDIALAILAGRGGERMSDILRRATSLKGAARERVLAQILVLSGLRGLPNRVQSELNRMGVIIDVAKNPVLELLLRQLNRKFGPLPKWARERIDSATTVQVEQWALRVIEAETLEGAIGKR